jgi:hypothetical protein
MRVRVVLEYVDRGRIQRVEMYLEADSVAAAEVAVFSLLHGDQAKKTFDLYGEIVDGPMNPGSKGDTT